MDLSKLSQDEAVTIMLQYVSCSELPVIATFAVWFAVTELESGILTSTLQVYTPELRTPAEVMLSTLVLSEPPLPFSSRIEILETLASSCVPS